MLHLLYLFYNFDPLIVIFSFGGGGFEISYSLRLSEKSRLSAIFKSKSLFLKYFTCTIKYLTKFCCFCSKLPFYIRTF